MSEQETIVKPICICNAGVLCSYNVQSLDYGIAIRVSGFSDKVPVSLYAANLPLCNSDPVDAGVGRVTEAESRADCVWRSFVIYYR